MLQKMFFFCLFVRIELSFKLKIQNNVCAICKNPETAKDKKTNCVRRMAIDHDHNTGAIRGLLCSNCNNGLGRFKDSRDYLQSAIKYLNNPPMTMGYLI